MCSCGQQSHIQAYRNYKSFSLSRHKTQLKVELFQWFPVLNLEIPLPYIFIYLVIKRFPCKGKYIAVTLRKGQHSIKTFGPHLGISAVRLDMSPSKDFHATHFSLSLAIVKPYQVNQCNESLQCECCGDRQSWVTDLKELTAYSEQQTFYSTDSNTCKFYTEGKVVQKNVHHLSLSLPPFLSSFLIY